MSFVASEVYMHVGNGGYSFSVEDQGFGPTLVVKQAFFGHETKTEIHTDVSSLIELASMLNTVINYAGYSEEYCNKATVERPRGGDDESEVLKVKAG